MSASIPQSPNVQKDAGHTNGELPEAVARLLAAPVDARTARIKIPAVLAGSLVLRRSAAQPSALTGALRISETLFGLSEATVTAEEADQITTATPPALRDQGIALIFPDVQVDGDTITGFITPTAGSGLETLLGNSVSLLQVIQDAGGAAEGHLMIDRNGAAISRVALVWQVTGPFTLDLTGKPLTFTAGAMLSADQEDSTQPPHYLIPQGVTAGGGVVVVPLTPEYGAALETAIEARYPQYDVICPPETPWTIVQRGSNGTEVVLGNQTIFDIRDLRFRGSGAIHVRTGPGTDFEPVSDLSSLDGQRVLTAQEFQLVTGDMTIPSGAVPTPEGDGWVVGGHTWILVDLRGQEQGVDYGWVARDAALASYRVEQSPGPAAPESPASGQTVPVIVVPRAGEARAETADRLVFGVEGAGGQTIAVIIENTIPAVDIPLGARPGDLNEYLGPAFLDMRDKLIGPVWFQFRRYEDMEEDFSAHPGWEGLKVIDLASPGHIVPLFMPVDVDGTRKFILYVNDEFFRSTYGTPILLYPDDPASGSAVRLTTAMLRQFGWLKTDFRSESAFDTNALNAVLGHDHTRVPRFLSVRYIPS